ncbi:hypothetical protein [Bacteroides helcogenes]|uniref:Uncharacterized protein n=1 Tax=Bacteroides helcogenes (strain ATCC 35417 / DSM 20613 / JCM 6297 / CCUG 15421 / P 36-108) TaxID=693979 RepID=E6SSR6_BACT6|nr:hypothetical protein [Bacteroides helcogenes]ADV43179.1 hypothetical protein Bache_1169 [Bacteroides helcogenes P 36-108]MDY5239158.1 hypothetical protein [Bacteroides helcogenes]
MEKHLYIFVISAFILLTACSKSTAPDPIKLTCNINTFDAPISCINQSPTDPDKLYIGQEDGYFIEKVVNNYHTYSINSNRRIYDILEYNQDTLFIGSRDAGLKLFTKTSEQTQSYYIKDKNLNYSVYSLARDDANQILYVGTSNGLYQLKLQDKNSCHELLPVKIGKGDKNCSINKVLIKDKKLYIASDLGLFIVQHPEQDFKRPVIDSLTTNISIYNDTVYALLENAIIKVAPNKEKTLMRKGKYYLYAQGPNKAEWFITGNSILYIQDQQTLVYELPDGISITAKQLGVMVNDFLYLACKEALLAFALRQHSADSENNVIAVSAKRTGDSIYFITDDLRLHLYKFIYNHPESKSKSLGPIEGLDVTGNDIIRFLETDKNTFFLATRKKLYKIKNNKAEIILQFSNSKGQNNITTLYYSPAEQRLYIGTRRYLGIVDDKAKRIVTPIPIVPNQAPKDTIDAYITGICENGDSIYVATLNKGLYGKPLKKEQAPFQQIRDLSDYESTYGLIANGKNIYLNTSLGIVNEANSELLPIRHVKDIAGVLEKNPNEGFFILYYYGLSFQGPDSPEVPTPLFNDLAFSKSCIAVNGRKAVVGCKSGLFLFDGKAELTPISIAKEKYSYTIYLLISAIALIISIAIFFLLKRKKQISQSPSEANLDEKRIILDDPTDNLDEIEKDIQAIDKQAKLFFDTLGIRKTEAEEDMRRELKQICLDFADKHPELGKLSFMKRRGKERYFITILLFIEDIDANIISRVLDVDQATVTRHKYNVRKEIEQLYPENEPDYNIIRLLYERVSTRKK